MSFSYQSVPYEATNIQDLDRFDDIQVIFCTSDDNPNKFIIDKLNATYRPSFPIKDLLETRTDSKGKIFKFTPKTTTEVDKSSPQDVHPVTIDHPNIYFVRNNAFQEIFTYLRFL